MSFPVLIPAHLFHPRSRIVRFVWGGPWPFYIVHNHSFWDFPNGGISQIVSTSAGTGFFDEDDEPIELVGGDVFDDWTLTFTSPTEFTAVGVVSGDVGSGNTSSDFEPNNPDEGAGYFLIFKEGWTGVWAADDTFRFRTTPREWVSEALYYPTDDTGNTFGYTKPGSMSTLVTTAYADARNLSQYVDAQLGFVAPSVWLGGQAYLQYDSIADSLELYTSPSAIAFKNIHLGQMDDASDDFVFIRHVVVTDLLPDEPTPTLNGEEHEINYPLTPAFDGAAFGIVMLAQGQIIADFNSFPSGYQLPFAFRRDGGWTTIYGGANFDTDRGFYGTINIAPNGDVTRFFFIDDPFASVPNFISDFQYNIQSAFSIQVYYTLNKSYAMLKGIIGTAPGLRTRNAKIYVDGVEVKTIYSIYVPYGFTTSNGFPQQLFLPSVASSPDGNTVVYALHDMIFDIDIPFGDGTPDEGKRLSAYPAWPPEFRILVNDVESTFAVETDIGSGVMRRSGFGTEEWNSYPGFFSQIAVNDSGQYAIASVSQGAGRGTGSARGFRNRFSVFQSTLIEDSDLSIFLAPLTMTGDNGGGMGAAITPAGVGLTLHRDWAGGTETTLTFRVADGSTFLWEQDVVSGTAAQLAEYPDILTGSSDITRIELYEISDLTSGSIRTRVYKIVIVYDSFLFNEWTMWVVTIDDVFDINLSDIFDPKGFIPNTSVGRPQSLSKAINLETSYALIVP